MSAVDPTDNSALLNAQLLANAQAAQPGTPGTPGHVTGEPNNVVTSQQFWALLNSSGVTGASGVGGVNGNAKAAAFANKYAGSMSRAFTFGAPPAPKAQTTPRTAAAYQSFSQEMQTAFAGAQGSTQANPGEKASMPTAQQMQSMSSQQAGQAVGNYLQNVMNNLQGAHGNLLLEFMKMRMKNNQQGASELQNMASLSSNLQSDTIEQQEAKSKAAMEAQQKAQKKTGIMKIFQPIIAAVMAIVSAVIAIVSFCTLVGISVLIAAMMAGFLAGGLAGAKGHGFNITDALNGLGYAADAVLLATGIGAILDTAMVMAKTVAEEVAKIASKMGLGAGENAGKEGLEESSNLAIKKAANESGGAVEAGTQKAADGSAEDLTKTMEAKRQEKELEGKISKLYKAMKTNSANFAADAGKQVSTKYGKFVEAMTGGAGNAESKMGDALLWGLTGMGLAQFGTSIAQAGMEYAISIPQTAAAEDVGQIQLYQATGDMWNKNYSTIENTLSSLTDAHSKTVDQVNAMLSSNEQASQAVLNNLALR